MQLARNESRLTQLTPEALGYRVRALWLFFTTSGRIGTWSHVGSGALMCGVLFLSPWLSGGIQPWSIYAIASALTLAAALWATWHWYQRPPDLTRSWYVAAALVTLIVGLGCVSVLNATNAWNPIDLTLVGPVEPDRFAPSTVHRRTTIYWLIQVAPVLAGLVVMADLARSWTWLRRLVASLAVSGTLLALYGTIQHLGLLPPLAEQPMYPRSVFAAFDNHGNAGAWLNLALPAAIAMAAVGGGRARAAWVVAAAVIVTGAIVNVSKIASLLAIAIVMLALGAALLKHRVGDRRELAFRVAKLAALPLIALLVLAWATGRVQTWSDMPRTIEADSGRRVMWGISARIAADSGAFGHGPGSFKLLIPTTRHFDPAINPRWAITRHVPGTAISQWSYPCNDLLQAWIEWGPAGTLLGLAIPTVAGFGLIRGLRRRGDAGRAIVAAASLVALGVVAFHAMGDFPLQIMSIQIAACLYLAIGWAMLAPPRGPASSPAAGA